MKFLGQKPSKRLASWLVGEQAREAPRKRCVSRSEWRRFVNGDEPWYLLSDEASVCAAVVRLRSPCQLPQVPEQEAAIGHEGASESL